MVGSEAARRKLVLTTATVFVAAAAPLALFHEARGHEGTYPIVLIHGWTGHGDNWREAIPKLEAQGFTVLDFDKATAGTQAMTYAPSLSGQHVSYLAGKIVEEKIQQALLDNGYSATQKVDVVGHSMGGLIARFLVEQPGADVDYWSDSTGWYGDGTADVRTDWKSRVDDLIMLGTPNHGTWEAWIPSTIGGFGIWNAAGGDMKPGARLLTKLGYAMPSGERYHAIGGDPAYLNFLQYDFDGDGVKHGFDGVVPAESPFVAGATMDYVGGHHGELLTADDAIDLVIEFLGQTSSQTGVGNGHLSGDVVVRLEYLKVAQDHDSGTTDEYQMDVYVDPDGSQGSAGYQLAGSIRHEGVNGPFTKNWGNTGPTLAAIKLPGTSPVIDVKVVVQEDDRDWGGGWEQVSTHYVTNVLLSEDIDGMDYYAKDATDAKGGTNTVRVSANGITSDVSETRYVVLGFDKALIQDDHDPVGNGEAQFTLNAGRVGFTTTVYRGDPGTGTHYSRSNNQWVDIGVDAKNNGVVEKETVWSGRMLKSATIRLDLTYWEDDGGWSSRDGGNQYYLETALSGIADGRTNYQGTSHADWDGYIYVTKQPQGGGFVEARYELAAVPGRDSGASRPDVVPFDVLDALGVVVPDPRIPTGDAAGEGPTVRS